MAISQCVSGRLRSVDFALQQTLWPEGQHYICLMAYLPGTGRDIAGLTPGRGGLHHPSGNPLWLCGANRPDESCVATQPCLPLVV
jgi:hypothetical protein